MQKDWVIFDVNNLAWRAFHTTGGLSHAGQATGVTYGVLREIKLQLDRHMTSNAVFCFDSPHSVRADEYGGYKESRKKKEFTPEQEQAYAGVQAQIKALQLDYLPQIGFKNRVQVRGFEADDMVAEAVSLLRKKGWLSHAHIVSSDKDLYQLLNTDVTLWKPGKDGTPTTIESFTDEYGIPPQYWIQVKAIAGCSSDDIPGVPRVGEATAAKWVAATCRGSTEPIKGVPQKVEAAINAFVASEEYKRNVRLVRLPHPALKGVVKTQAFRFLYEQPPVTARDWKKVTERLGINTLV